MVQNVQNSELCDKEKNKQKNKNKNKNKKNEYSKTILKRVNAILQTISVAKTNAQW